MALIQNRIASVKMLSIGLCLLATLTMVGCLPSLRNLQQVLVSQEEALKALELAMDQIGCPYVWGGRNPRTGFDCSGLIVWAYRRIIPGMEFRIGQRAFRDASISDLYRWNVTLLPVAKLSPGDLVFLSDKTGKITHGGLFIDWVETDRFRFVNASSYEGIQQVVIDEWPRTGEKRGQRFVGGGRLTVIRN